MVFPEHTVSLCSSELQNMMVWATECLKGELKGSISGYHS